MATICSISPGSPFCYTGENFCLVLLGLFLAARVGARLVPRGLQNAAELLLETLLRSMASMVGQPLATMLFPVAATFFLFIMVNALVSLLPIYGPVFVLAEDGGHLPLLRGAGTDVNMALALAILGGILVEASGLISHRASYVRRFIRVGNLLRGRIFIGVIDLFTGLIEGLTRAFRLLSFSFRLLGSMTAGEILILVASFLIPFVLPTPFYGLEMLIAVVQAWILTTLVVVFCAEAISEDPSAGREGDDA